MSYELHVIHEGYSEMVDDSSMVANCSCTLLMGQHNIIVDTMTAWDKDIIVEGLKKHSLCCDDIHYVVCSHSHSDHIGNNSLFTSAKLHVVGFSINNRDQYTLHPFDLGEALVIDEDVMVIPTPGHTGDDVTVLVKTRQFGTVAVTGDLFEREEDIKNPDLWQKIAGSQCPEKQEMNRKKVLSMADYIVPGHGPMFKVCRSVCSSVEPPL